MKNTLLTSRKLQLVSAIVALTIHGAIAALAMQQEVPVMIPERQIIKVSMVAPTTIKQSKVQPEKKLINTLKLPEKKRGMIKQEEKRDQPQKPVKQEQLSDEMQKQQLTSGLKQKDALDKLSAITKPVAANYLDNPPPTYPEKARLNKHQGTVLLDVLVEKEGSPKTIAIHTSSGYRSLDQAAVSAVKRWKFEPARRGRKQVEATVTIPVIFKLN